MHTLTMDLPSRKHGCPVVRPQPPHSRRPSDLRSILSLRVAAAVLGLSSLSPMALPTMQMPSSAITSEYRYTCCSSPVYFAGIWTALCSCLLAVTHPRARIRRCVFPNFVVASSMPVSATNGPPADSSASASVNVNGRDGQQTALRRRSFLLRGLYVYQLARWLELFPLVKPILTAGSVYETNTHRAHSRMLILRSEEIFANLSTAADLVMSLTGIDTKLSAVGATSDGEHGRSVTCIVAVPTHGGSDLLCRFMY